MLNASTRPPGGRSRPIYPCGKARKNPLRRRFCGPEKRPMKWRHPILFFVGLFRNA